MRPSARPSAGQTALRPCRETNGSTIKRNPIEPLPRKSEKSVALPFAHSAPVISAGRDLRHKHERRPIGGRAAALSEGARDGTPSRYWTDLRRSHRVVRSRPVRDRLSDPKGDAQKDARQEA
jgi:hypothetical protein